MALTDTSTSKNITLTNASSADVYIGSLTMSNNEFLINWNSCPTPPDKLESQDTCVANVSAAITISAALKARG